VPAALCMGDRHHRYEAAEMETIGGRIETYVDGARRLGEMAFDIIAGNRFEKPTPTKL
jgi:hypothetical protein